MARTKKLTWIDVKVGIFVFVGFVIMLAMILIVGTNNQVFTPKYTLHMFVPNVISLNEGAFVTIAGIKSGTIGDFEFIDKDSVRGVSISLFIETQYQDKITASSRAMIKTLGILGDKYVEVTLGQPGEQPLHDGDWITANAPIDFEALAPRGVEIIDNLSGLLQSGKEVLDEFHQGDGTIKHLINDNTLATELTAAVKGLNQLLVSMNNPGGSLGKMLQQPQAYDNLVAASDNLNAVLREIRSGKGTLGQLVQDDTIYRRLAATTASADSITSRLQQGNGSAGKMLRDEEVYKRLSQLLEQIQSLLDDMTKYPQKYFNIKVF